MNVALFLKLHYLYSILDKKCYWIKVKEDESKKQKKGRQKIRSRRKEDKKRKEKKRLTKNMREWNEIQWSFRVWRDVVTRYSSAFHLRQKNNCIFLPKIRLPLQLLSSFFSQEFFTWRLMIDSPHFFDLHVFITSSN